MKCVKRTLVTLLLLSVGAAWAAAQDGPMPFSRTIWKDVEQHAKDYVKLREKHAATLPKLDKAATPEQIHQHKLALQKLVLEARAGAVEGNIFVEPSPGAIRALIKKAYTGFERSELRKTVLEADTQGVRIAVNAVYPETKELVEMSPPLLLALPQLPKELRYRFVGRSLVILDRDSGLILDILREALP